MISIIGKKVFSNVFKATKTNQLKYSPKAYFSGKDIRFGTECRERMLQGCSKLAETVSITLGKIQFSFC